MKSLLFLSLIILSISANLRFLQGNTPSAGQVKGLENFNKAMDKINGVVDCWKNIAGAFRTTINTTIKQKLHIDGYSKFDGRAKMFLYNGIERDYWNNVKMNQLFKMVKLKKDEQKVLKDTIEDAEYSDKSVWTNMQTLHNPDDPNNRSGLDFFSIIINNLDNEDDELSVLITHITTKLTLAPDIYVINKDRSFVGGIYADCKDEFKKVPKSLTNKDLQDIMLFFKIFFVHHMCNFLGFHIELPKI